MLKKRPSMRPSSARTALFSSRPLNLTVFALVCVYALFAGWMVAQGGMADPVGGDFRAFLASAQIAHTLGYVEVYNLQVQKEFQEAVASRYRTGEIDVLPVFFLPIFIVPFQIFLPLGFPAGFGMWTLLNLGALALFVRRFTRGNHFLPLLGWLLASFPVFANFLWGQVNVWLLWCVACFLEAWEKGKPFHGGLWLGGLLLKPQTLVWLIPALVLSREREVLAGFGLAALVLLLSSLVLAGPEGMLAWLRLPLQYMEESPAIVPEAMTNVRALGKVLAFALPSEWAWGIAAATGLIAVALSLWTTLVAPRRGSGAKPSLLLSWLAATCATTWHSYGHTAIILIPPLIRQAMNEERAKHSLVFWVLLPSAVFVAIGLFAVPLLMALKGLTPPVPSIAYPALTLLGFNIYFIVREALEAWRSTRRTP